MSDYAKIEAEMRENGEGCAKLRDHIGARIWKQGADDLAALRAENERLRVLLQESAVKFRDSLDNRVKSGWAMNLLHRIEAALAGAAP